MNPSTALARWLVDELVRRGVGQAVLCPGSRNAPLSFALEAHPGIELHSRIDERTAAFVALGMAKSSRHPVVVCCTSGTAAANLHPGVLEAAHAGVPLIALTADRPAALRGTGANQTTDQVRLFGTAASFCDLDAPDPAALDAAFGESPTFSRESPVVVDRIASVGGPIHLNVQFAEPLMPDAPSSRLANRADKAGDWRHQGWRVDAPSVATRLDGGARRVRTVVVAGDDAGPPARMLAEGANWPLLAEPTSGSRNGESPIRTYRLLLEGRLGQRVERAVVFGHPTLSRPVTRLLGRDDVEVVSVRSRGRWPDRPFPVAAEYDAVSADADDPGWLEEWREADRALSARLDEFVQGQPALNAYDVAAEVNAAVPSNGLLYVGASNPLRDLDLMARPYPVGERRLLLSNRGLAGIDGTVSSAIGAVLGRPRTSRGFAYLGDVTFLHDLTALVMGPHERRPDLTIVVANDNGGSIFVTLEQGAPEFTPSYDKLFGTPHGVDVASVCAGLHVPHWKVTDRAELRHALTSPNGGIEVVEAVIDREDRRALDEAVRALGAQA